MPDPVPAAAKEDFPTWLTGVRSEALARGISEQTVDAAFTGLEPLPVVIERDRAQAELVLSLDDYLKRRLTRSFIRTARECAATHRDLLKRVSTEYGVQSKFLVAIWGVESNYGRFIGVRPTIQALATLAWDGRRGAFFKGELFNALEIVDKGYIGLDQLQGIVGRRHGADAVHALELSETRAGLRSRRRSGHLAVAGRHLRVDCQLPEGLRLGPGSDVGTRSAPAEGRCAWRDRARLASGRPVAARNAR